MSSKNRKRKALKFALPEWTDERHIWIVVGQEPYGYRESVVEKGPKRRMRKYRWWKKTGRCNLCGKCCMGLKEDWIWGVNEKGVCSRLVEGSKGEFYCDPNMGGMPWDCLKGDGRENIPECTVRYEEVDGLD